MVVNKANSFNLLPILTILSIGFLLSLPALLNGSLNGHDLPLHLRWSQYFSSQSCCSGFGKAITLGPILTQSVIKSNAFSLLVGNLAAAKPPL